MRSGRAEREARWQNTALHRGWRARCLWPLSVVYGALIRWRRWLYTVGLFKSRRLRVPVIVVGNVVVGGAGKTPTVVALVEHLRCEGWHPGVISRGYGRQSTDTLAVEPDTPAEASGDEPALIRRATGVPVFVAGRRWDAAQALLAAHPQVDVLLCDDGLQHLALWRDLNVVVFDERGTGNGWLLPAGLLREPWPMSAPMPHLLVLRQHREGAAPPVVPLSSGMQTFNAVRRLADHAVSPAGERRPLASFRGQAVAAVAGIARPAVFFDMLRERGLTLTREQALPDHAEASAFDQLNTEQGPLLCTEKDAVKLFRPVADPAATQAPPFWAVPLELVPEPDFFKAVTALLARAGPDG
jgi:tetraacyldisaccharide 4'-kinase